MNLSFYDPNPPVNDYLAIMYFGELRKFCADKGIPVEEIEDLMTVKNSTVLVNASHLIEGVIPRLKENGNTVISFDINDNTYFTDVVPEDDMVLIDLIFKVAGLQKTESSYELVIDDDLNYIRKKFKFRDGNWGRYFDVLESGRIRPLPHVPWGPVIADEVSWEERSQRSPVLLRGSHQYLRVHLYLHLLMNGLVDKRSMFPGSMYIHQFCDVCKATFKKHGRLTYENLTDSPCRLDRWRGDVNQSEWNNGCLPRYFDLATMFEEKHGGMNFKMIEDALDGMWTNGWQNTILNRYLFYADHKWVFSIYTPPRFWEAAGSGTVNFINQRTRDQEQFPKIEEYVHYVPYKDDYSDLSKVRDITKSEFEYISNNALKLYSTWIKPARYRVSDNLLQHIVDEISNA